LFIGYPISRKKVACLLHIWLKPPRLHGQQAALACYSTAGGRSNDLDHLKSLLEGGHYSLQIDFTYNWH